MVGAVEAFFMIYPDMKFSGYLQVYGSFLSAATAGTVILFAHQIHQISFLFALIVGFSLFSVYAGLVGTGEKDGVITGQQSSTFDVR